MTGIVALLLFAFFALVGYAVSGWAQDREETKEALGRRLTSMTGAPVGGASAALIKDRRLSRIGPLNVLLQQLGVTKNLVRRSEEHTSELQSRLHLVCRLLLEKKKNDHSTHNKPD